MEDDSRKAMAIVNLQAIINEEDVDKIITLLQQNDWDESVSQVISSLSLYKHGFMSKNELVI